jgi:acetyl-CoA acetyltransferase
MGETAEEVAALDGITRADSDAFALRSHQRAIAAIDAGRFDREITPVPVKDGEVSVDEIPRRGSTTSSARRAAHGLPRRRRGHRRVVLAALRRRGRRRGRQRRGRRAVRT